MGRTVEDAAILLTAMVGKDPADPLADIYPPSVPDYAANLSKDALKGARIGVLRTHSGAGNDARVDQIILVTIATLESLGAEVVDPVEIETEGMGSASRTVLYYEFKADLNSYLQSSGAPLQTMEDIIAFNDENADIVMPFFGQERMLAAQEKGPLTDSDYLEALALSKQISQAGIDHALAEHRLDALIAPTRGPALPAGDVLGLPIGVSFIGGNFSDAQLIRFAYAFEQASQARRPPEL